MGADSVDQRQSWRTREQLWR